MPTLDAMNMALEILSGPPHFVRGVIAQKSGGKR
jgi:hypothetical protein